MTPTPIYTILNGNYCNQTTTSRLGNGWYGSVWALTDNTVLKVTEDAGIVPRLTATIPGLKSVSAKYSLLKEYFSAQYIAQFDPELYESNKACLAQELVVTTDTHGNERLGIILPRHEGSYDQLTPTQSTQEGAAACCSEVSKRLEKINMTLRDLKASNTLFSTGEDQQKVFTVSDFGLAEFKAQSTITEMFEHFKADCKQNTPKLYQHIEHIDASLIAKIPFIVRLHLSVQDAIWGFKPSSSPANEVSDTEHTTPLPSPRESIGDYLKDLHGL